MSARWRAAVPIEIAVYIVSFVPLRRFARFKAAVALRLPSVRDDCIVTDKRLSIDSASRHGLIHILEWWRTSGRTLHYTAKAIDYAASSQVLEWWRTSGLSLCYTSLAIDECHSIEKLEWWRTSGLELKYTNVALDLAEWNGSSAVIDWWNQSGLKLLIGYPP